MNKYGKRLKELRKTMNMTQDDLAERLNTSRSRIGMYEQGRRQPDFEMQEAIADLFNVNIDYLFGRSDDERKSLVELSSGLNEEGYTRLLEYAKFLQGKYSKNNTPPEGNESSGAV